MEMEEEKEKMPLNRIINLESEIKNFGCQSCKNLVIGTLRICKNCDYHLCDNCHIKSWSKNESCNICKSTKSFLGNTIKESDLSFIKLKCKHFDSGCKDILFYSNYLSHEANCIYRTINCEECKNAHFFFKDKDAHYEICGSVKVSCNQCNKKVKRGKIDSHKKDRCLIYYHSCIFCTKNIINFELNAHKKICPIPISKCIKCNNNELKDHNCLIEISKKAFTRLNIIKKAIRDENVMSMNILNSNNLIDKKINENFQKNENKNYAQFCEIKQATQENTSNIIKEERLILNQINSDHQVMDKLFRESNNNLINISSIVNGQKLFLDDQLPKLALKLENQEIAITRNGEMSLKQEKFMRDNFDQICLSLDQYVKKNGEQTSLTESLIKNKAKEIQTQGEMIIKQEKGIEQKVANEIVLNEQQNKKVMDQLIKIDSNLNSEIKILKTNNETVMKQGKTIEENFSKINLLETSVKAIGQQIKIVESSVDRGEHEMKAQKDILQKFESNIEQKLESLNSNYLTNFKNINDVLSQFNSKIDTKFQIEAKLDKNVEIMNLVLSNVNKQNDQVVNLLKENLERGIVESNVYKEAITKQENEKSKLKTELETEKKSNSNFKIQISKNENANKGLQIQIDTQTKLLDESKNSIKDLSNENNESKKKIENLEQNLKTTKDELSKIKTNFDKGEQENKKLTNEKLELLKRIEVTKKELEGKLLNLNSLNESFAKLQKELEKLNKEKEDQINICKNLEKTMKVKNDEISDINNKLSKLLSKLKILLPNHLKNLADIPKDKKSFEIFEKLIDNLPPTQQMIKCLICKNENNYEHIVNCIRKGHKTIQFPQLKFVEFLNLEFQKITKEEIKFLINLSIISKTLQFINFSLIDSFDEECGQLYIDAIKKNDSFIGIILNDIKISRLIKIEILKLFVTKKNLKFYLVDRKEINENEVKELSKNAKLNYNNQNSKYWNYLIKIIYKIYLLLI